MVFSVHYHLRDLQVMHKEHEVKVLTTMVVLAVIIAAVLLFASTNLLALASRTFCMASTAIFAGASTLGLAARVRA